jgi:hypothetical protein
MKSLRKSLLLASLAILATSAPSARANVYASNIKLNGVLSGSASVGVGSGATITYILNDAATAGVSVKILLAGVAVRTINIAAGNPGTTRGLNTVNWDGNNDVAVPVPPGTYSVSVNAGHNGYSHWTPITHDTDPGNSAAHWPDGLAVDTNTNSPYYGRVMVGNGDAINAGIFKCNADGSLADEGQSNAGYGFPTDGYLGDSVRSMKYIADDRIVFNNWTGDGQIVACDMIMSTNQILWDSANVPGAPWVALMVNGFADIDVAFPGTTNAIACLADFHYPSQGVWMWPLTNNGAYDPNFGGIQLLESSGSCADTLRTGLGLMVDDAYDLFMGQVRGNPADPTPRLFDFTNWPSTTLPLCTENLNWAAGAGDDTFRYISDLCLNSRQSPTYVSAALSGASGGIRILYVTNGMVAGNIEQFEVAPVITGISAAAGIVTIRFTGDPTRTAADFSVVSTNSLSDTFTAFGPTAGVTITGSGGSFTASLPMSDSQAFYAIKQNGVYFISTSWDAVGNVYGGTGAHVWRAFSPPGANQATTVAVATVEVHL